MRHCLVLALLFAAAGCAQQHQTQSLLELKGRWLTESTGEVMLDPQTSGLKSWRGKLVSISDGSAHVSQRLQLHIIDPQSATVEQQSLPIRLSEEVAQGCFGPYLSHAPDLEALAIDPDDDKVIVLVTEDATRSEGLSEQCAQQYANSGSTDYPTLLLRTVLQPDNSLLLDAVRPIQYEQSHQIGNFPNDGIEGLAFAEDRTLYLGLEKDVQSKARIFSLQINAEFWQTNEFAKVTDAQLLLPDFESGNHPINGMDYYTTAKGQSVLIAAARNDSTLWIIDLAKHRPAVVIPLHFYAPTSKECGQWELMDNASLEGVAVAGDTLYVVNDPWKRHYMENVTCEINRDKYQKMAPLIFSMPIEKGWLPASH